MKSVIVTTPGKIEIQDVPKPTPSAYQALVRTEMVAICNATDSKLIAGHFPGEDKYPMALGHENVGIVEAVGDKVRNFKVGDRVIGGLLADFGGCDIHSGWGGFSEYVLAHDHDAMVADGVADAEHGWFESCEIQNAVPAGVEPEEAVISCTWREVLGAFKDFNLKPGNKVIIFGSGPVGLSFVKLGKAFGLGQIDVVDMLPEKLELAKKMGADNVYTSDVAAGEEFIRKNGRTYDNVIDAVGLPVIVSNALPLVKMSGDICVYGVMTKNPTLDMDKAPLNFDLHVHRWPTRSEERAAMITLAKWINEGKLSAKDFISHRFKIEQFDEAFEAVKQGKVIKTVLTF